MIIDKTKVGIASTDSQQMMDESMTNLISSPNYNYLADRIQASWLRMIMKPIFKFKYVVQKISSNKQ